MLPPGVNSKDFSDALKQFEAAVGKEWVFTSDEDVALYRDAYSPFWGEPEERVASAAVAPGKVEDVQAVMKIANEYKIPVYPISTGKNLGYGGSAPNLSGSVVLDLKRMNRILDVSERNHSALVEPGDGDRAIIPLRIEVMEPEIGDVAADGMDGRAPRFPVFAESHAGRESLVENHFVEIGVRLARV